MLGNHQFYHRTIRKMVVVFGTLFNDIEIVRYTQAGVAKEKLKVPLSYGPKERYLTAITSDPNLSLDELGVPIKIAMNVTVPEIVTAYNIDKLAKLVKNGRTVYPGANYVIPANTPDGKRYTIDLRYRKKGIKLRPGDIVERHLQNRDPVLFNRQPSLHKLSMM